MSTPMNANMIEILLVDDDPGDVRLTVEALKQTKMHTNLSFARDGIEALAFLRRQGKFSRRAAPGHHLPRPEHAAHGRPRSCLPRSSKTPT